MTTNDNSKTPKKPLSSLDFYKVIHTIGDGSTSKVKLVLDPFSGAFYAAKIIKLSPHLPHYQYRSMLLTEVRCLRKLSHRNIVKIFTYKEAGSYISKSKGFYSCMYIVLEYCPHGELFSFLKKNGSFTEGITLYYFRQIIDALESCNTSGYNHGDLSPENLLIAANFDIKICDFGLCSEIDINSARNLGNKKYLPPEVIIGLKYEPIKADLFVAGMILFIMYVGCPPFKVADNEDLYYDLLRNRTELFWAYFQNKHPEKVFDESFKELVEGLLRFEPNQRYSYEDIKGNLWFQKMIDEDLVMESISNFVN